VQIRKLNHGFIGENVSEKWIMNPDMMDFKLVWLYDYAVKK
jgi:hypothetical protein